MLPNIPYSRLDWVSLPFHRQARIVCLVRLLLLLHLCASHKPHLCSMAGETGSAAVASTGAIATNRHAICDPGAGERKGVDVRVGVPGSKARVAAKGRRRETGVGGLGMGGMVLLGLLLLQMGLLEVRVGSVYAGRAISADRRRHLAIREEVSCRRRRGRQVMNGRGFSDGGRTSSRPGADPRPGRAVVPSQTVAWQVCSGLAKEALNLEMRRRDRRWLRSSLAGLRSGRHSASRSGLVRSRDRPGPVFLGPDEEPQRRPPPRPLASLHAARDRTGPLHLLKTSASRACRLSSSSASIDPEIAASRHLHPPQCPSATPRGSTSTSSRRPPRPTPSGPRGTPGLESRPHFVLVFACTGLTCSTARPGATPAPSLDGTVLRAPSPAWAGPPSPSLPTAPTSTSSSRTSTTVTRRESTKHGAGTKSKEEQSVEREA